MLKRALVALLFSLIVMQAHGDYRVVFGTGTPSGFATLEEATLYGQEIVATGGATAFHIIGAARACAAVVAGTGAGVGTGTAAAGAGCSVGAVPVAIVGGVIVIGVAAGDVAYSGYCASQSGTGVGSFLWQTGANYGYYCNPYNWNWAR